MSGWQGPPTPAQRLANSRAAHRARLGLTGDTGWVGEWL